MKIMKDIAIYGAGGFGCEVACLIQWINNVSPTWNLIGFFDDGKQKGEVVSHFGRIIGGLQELNAYKEELSIVFAIGNNNVIFNLVNQIKNKNIEYPNLVAPDFFIKDTETFSIGKGNIIQNRCEVSCNVTIGDFNIFNCNISLGHDVTLGDFNMFMPDVRISGNVTVGELNFFGLGSKTLQRIKIGNKIRLGAGSVLMTKPKNDNLYMGVPAKLIKI